MAAYTSNTPQSSEFPSTSQPLMLANNQYLALFGAKDHEFTENSTNPNDGTHKQVSLNNLSGSPGFHGASCVVYSKQVNPPSNMPATQLFYDASNPSAPVQLTSHTPQTSLSGYSYLPGGLMIIWGQNIVAGGAGIDFPIDPDTGSPLQLSAPVYSVQCTFTNTSGNLGFTTVQSTGTQGFGVSVWERHGNPTTATISWIAIGPA